MDNININCNYKVLKYNKNYLITENGELYSLRFNKFLNGQICGNGYLRYTISSNGETSRYFAHRLVAEHFIENPNPDKFTIVNHKDLNKLNNNKDNLEWTDVQGNTQHAANNNLLCKKREREYYNKDLENEKWVEIKNYEDYLISSYGRIKNKDNLLLKYWKRGHEDYDLVTLHKNGAKSNFSVHVLVYYSFNTDKEQDASYVIDHIDGNKSNNTLSNLRRIKQSENVKAAYYEQKLNKRCHKSKSL